MTGNLNNQKLQNKNKLETTDLTSLRGNDTSLKGLFKTILF